MQRGKFIVVEGPEASGKTTQTHMIHEYISLRLSAEPEAQRPTVLLSKEPGSPHLPICLKIRNLLGLDSEAAMHLGYPVNGAIPKHLDALTQGLLFYLDHWNHTQWVSSIVDQGHVVVSDRWGYSQFAYDAVRPNPQAIVTRMYREHMERCIVPDKTFVIIIDPDTAMRRLLNRDERERRLDKKPWGRDPNLISKLNQAYATTTIHNRVDLAIGNLTAREFFVEKVQPQIDRLFGWKS